MRKDLFSAEFNKRFRTTSLSISPAQNGQYEARSAGVTKGAEVKVTSELLHWADLIFVMEEEQRKFLLKKFSTDIGFREIIILDIPDTYYIMEPELVDLIIEAVSPYLD
jgi:predicted protein tyrosine phosphatase